MLEGCSTCILCCRSHQHCIHILRSKSECEHMLCHSMLNALGYWQAEARTSLMRYDPWAKYCSPIECTTNTRNCCSHVTENLRKIHTYGADLAHWTVIFWAIHTTLVRLPILQQEEFRSLICAMTIVKTLLRWDKCIRVLWDYVNK